LSYSLSGIQETAPEEITGMLPATTSMSSGNPDSLDKAGFNGQTVCLLFRNKNPLERQGIFDATGTAGKVTGIIYNSAKDYDCRPSPTPAPAITFPGRKMVHFPKYSTTIALFSHRGGTIFTKKNLASPQAHVYAQFAQQ
jgi:hypothetical protein